MSTPYIRPGVPGQVGTPVGVSSFRQPSPAPTQPYQLPSWVPGTIRQAVTPYLGPGGGWAARLPQPVVAAGRTLLAGLQQPAYGAERAAGGVAKRVYQGDPFESLTPKQQQEVSRITWSWLGNPDKMANIATRLQKGEDVENVLKTEQVTWRELAGQIVVDPLNLIGFGLTKLRTARGTKAATVARGVMTKEEMFRIPSRFELFTRGLFQLTSPTPKTRMLNLSNRSGRIIDSILRGLDDIDDMGRVARTLQDTPQAIARLGMTEDAQRLSHIMRAMNVDWAKATYNGWDEAGQIVTKVFDSLVDARAGKFAEHPEVYKYALTADLEDMAMQFGRNVYKVPPPSFATNLTGKLKAGMSLVFLGYNPGYVVRNILTNEALPIIHGVSAWHTPAHYMKYASKVFGIEEGPELVTYLQKSGIMRGFGAAAEMGGEGAVVTRAAPKVGGIRGLAAQAPGIRAGAWAETRQGFRVTMGKMMEVMQNSTPAVIDEAFSTPSGMALLDDLEAFEPGLGRILKQTCLQFEAPGVPLKEAVTRALGGEPMVAHFVDDIGKLSPGEVGRLQEALDSVGKTLQKLTPTEAVEAVRGALDDVVREGAEHAAQVGDLADEVFQQGQKLANDLSIAKAQGVSIAAEEIDEFNTLVRTQREAIKARKALFWDSAKSLEHRGRSVVGFVQRLEDATERLNQRTFVLSDAFRNRAWAQDAAIRARPGPWGPKGIALDDLWTNYRRVQRARFDQRHARALRLIDMVDQMMGRPPGAVPVPLPPVRPPGASPMALGTPPATVEPLKGPLTILKGPLTREAIEGRIAQLEALQTRGQLEGLPVEELRSLRNFLRRGEELVGTPPAAVRPPEGLLAGIPGKLPDIADVSAYETSKVADAVEEFSDWARKAELEARIAARRFPQKLLFTVWDYKEGAFKKGVDQLSTAPHYRGIPLDVLMTEYGFDDYNKFLAAIEQQVSQNRIIKFLKGGYPISIPDDLMERTFAFLDTEMSPRRAEQIHAAREMGLRIRGETLLNYGRHTYADQWLGHVFPYEFWYAHTAANLLKAMTYRPQMLVHYYRLKRALEETTSAPGFPARMRGKVRIRLPFLPDWMGDELFIDPLRTLTPFPTFTEPYLPEYEEEGGLAKGVRAVSSIMSPAPWLMWPAVATGALGPKENWVTGPQLPPARYLKGLTGLAGIGPPGGVSIAPVRAAMGLPQTETWDIYRANRMVSNMAATGEISDDEWRDAMMNHRGPVWEEAVRRAAQERGITVTGQMAGISGLSVYPTGERQQRELQQEMKRRIEEVAPGYYDVPFEERDEWATEQGLTQKIKDVQTKFYDEHPEYSARTMLWKDPRERTIAQIWEGYMNRSTSAKRAARNALGDKFVKYFVDKEKRDYSKFTTQELADIAERLGMAAGVARVAETEREEALRPLVEPEPSPYGEAAALIPPTAGEGGVGEVIRPMVTGRRPYVPWPSRAERGKVPYPRRRRAPRSWESFLSSVKDRDLRSLIGKFFSQSPAQRMAFARKNPKLLAWVRKQGDARLNMLYKLYIAWAKRYSQQPQQVTPRIGRPPQLRWYRRW